MKKIIILTVVIGLLLSSTSLGLGFGEEFLSSEAEEIFKEIEETEDTALVVDKIIGDRYVKYWEHVIDDVSVKNDSILLHLDVETGDILKYEKSWRLLLEKGCGFS